ncbi:hypothetical protein V490_01520 [Pseudogymnoascus sp. VKM F-3557]|nr:hypothetical protein V490_01520 [Pseudogymnoascus sp. VKM F-3557]
MDYSIRPGSKPTVTVLVPTPPRRSRVVWGCSWYRVERRYSVFTAGTYRNVVRAELGNPKGPSLRRGSCRTPVLKIQALSAVELLLEMQLKIAVKVKRSRNKCHRAGNTDLFYMSLAQKHQSCFISTQPQSGPGERKGKHALCSRSKRTLLFPSTEWDFWLAWITYILGLCANIFCNISVHYGAGQHMDDLDPEAAKVAIMWQWILFQTYVVAHMFGKLAIIAFLLEFERDLPLTRKYLLYVVGAINVAVNMGTSSLQWQQCKPVAKTWDDDIAGVCVGRERNTQGGFVQGSFGAAIDIFLTVYPIAVFWQLKMSLNIKIGLSILFSFGLITAACAIVKTVGISLLGATDTTYQLATLDIYSLTEMWIVLIVGCLPPTKQLVTRLVRKARGFSSQGQSSGIAGARTSKRGYIAQVDPSRSGPEYDHRSDVTSKKPTPSDSEEDILVHDGIKMTRTVNVDQRYLNS